MRKHLASAHLEDWVDACDKFKIPIIVPGVQATINEYRQRKGRGTTANPRNPSMPDRQAFSPEAFVDAIVEFIVADDQSLRVIESPHLRRIFLMLREELTDSDIPHRTKIRSRLSDIWTKHLDSLEDEMKVWLCCYIYIRLGWTTLDNASNNDTFMESLEVEMRRRHIPFNHVKQ
ncbi:hypothetical protein BJ165DRAFT_1357267 [Panaeolus papilionaceus]|nr:hypothetical protein BJ165DRAFT_1357267 [Panaeolus papilionaceus]